MLWGKAEGLAYPMICPICHHDGARRSRRRTLADYVLSVTGVYPWRCEGCHGRFHARLMPLSQSLHAHCPICGNLSLRRISPEYVDSLTGPIWRILHIPAFRCDPCRYKYFSIRPVYHEREERAEASPAE